MELGQEVKKNLKKNLLGFCEYIFGQRLSKGTLVD